MHVATSEVYATTTTVVVGTGGCLVVDPAVTAREVADLAATLHARGWRPDAIWSTHPHWDHLLDAPALHAVPRWAGTRPEPGWRDRAERQRDADPVLAAHLAARPDDRTAPVCSTSPTPFPGSEQDVDGWCVLDWDGPQVRVLRHDAHCAGHTALVVVDAGVLVAGDMLSDVEVPLLDTSVPGAVCVYQEALRRLEAGAVRYGADRVVPGHGAVGDAGSASRRIADDRRFVAGLPGDRATGPGASPDAAQDDPRLGPGAPAWLRTADRAQREALARR